METKVFPCGLYSASSLRRSSSASDLRSINDSARSDEEATSNSFNLSNISKIMLPPLGVSGFDHKAAKSPSCIISPINSKYRCWETLMVGLVAYSAWVYPFEVAFMKSCPNAQLFIADNIVNVFFAVDIVLTFFVAYIDSRTQLLVYDSKEIAIRSRSFFLLYFFS
ncbi:hypothetical protein Cgig2_022219 [Carnegiea gigantea]|uniref:Ion transport domain-containing protein n=1 Tax=Carnegiea gigantea TaxID=171969 RepID=A0A9Q1JM60_9CARY|nr:hypothetical protein Cgig2_022219 [Carnegiea gigantea]